MTLRQEKLFVSVAIQSIVAVIFFWIETVNGSVSLRAPVWFPMSLDRRLPFVPGAVWLYVSWYAAPLILLRLPRETFRRASAAVIVGFFLCAVFYAILPLPMERPVVRRDGLSTAVLDAVYSIDKPRNIFPSFHATVCAVLTMVTPGRPGLRVAMVAWTSAICVSCVLTKQHYVLDVVAGLCVGTVAVVITDWARRWTSMLLRP